METSANQRLTELLNFAHKNARQLSKDLNCKSPQIFYDIKSGKCGFSKSLSGKIQELFPDINPTWLMTGEGQMLKSSVSIGGDNSGVVINGNNSDSPIDNRHYYADSPDVLRAQIAVLDERIKEKDAQIKEKDAQIKEKDAQIKKLLDILAK